MANQASIEEDFAKLYRARTRKHDYEVTRCQTMDEALAKIRAEV